MAFVLGFPAYFIGFLHGLTSVPHVYYAVVVAIFFGLATVSRAGILVVPLIAAIVYVAALAVGPVVFDHAKLVVPAFDLALAKQILAAYLVFLVADSVVYAVKKAILRVID